LENLNLASVVRPSSLFVVANSTKENLVENPVAALALVVCTSVTTFVTLDPVQSVKSSSLKFAIAAENAKKDFVEVANSTPWKDEKEPFLVKKPAIDFWIAATIR